MAQPIRVLHVNGIMNYGGAEAMIMNLYRQIDRDNVQFDFIVHSEKDGYYDKEIALLGGKKHICPRYTVSNHIAYVRWWKNFFSAHPEYKILHSHIRSTASIYLPIAKNQGITTIAHSHSTSNGHGLKALLKNILQLKIRYQADYLFACSQEAGNWLFGKTAAHTQRFKIIPNSIDTHRFLFNEKKRKEVRCALGIDDAVVIGHVGSFTEVKNHMFLLKCFAEYHKKVPNSKLLLVGEGGLEKSIKEQVLKQGLINDVIFLGAKANVQDYYQAMDCFIFPSLWEGLGIAIVEAQASGLPCVVSDKVPRSVDIGAGLVDFVSLHEPLANWISKIRKIERKDTSVYIKNSGFDVEENAKKLQKFYEEIWK